MTVEADLAALQARVAALEANQNGGDTFSPNLLSLDAEGHVTATFSGLINALGVVIPESTSSSFQLPNAIEWTDAGGTAREFIEGQTAGGVHRLGLQAGVGGSGGNNSFIDLDDTPQVIAGANDTSGDSDVVTLVNSLGETSWLRLGTIGRVFITWGSKPVTWTGGQQTPGAAVPFGLTYSQVQAVLLGVTASLVPDCGAAYSSLTDSGMNVYAWSPVAPVSGDTATISWAAIGTLPTP